MYREQLAASVQQTWTKSYKDVSCIWRSVVCVCVFNVIPSSIMQLIVPTSEHFRQDQHQIASGGAMFNSFSAISFLL